MELQPPRVALVTGSSRGLGRWIAARLARDGFAVAINGSSEERVREVVAGIRADGGTADGFVADVTDAQAVSRLVEDVRARLGPVLVLVLNATGPQPEGPIGAVGWGEHLDQLSFFVKSPVLLANAVLSDMRAAGFGRIIAVDSEVVDTSPPGRSAYVTAKSAQVALMRAWARELAPIGITVNAVAPGFIPVERHAGVSPEERATYLASVPVGRMGTPDDVAAAVSFFASDEAGFLTGQRLVVNGGRRG